MALNALLDTWGVKNSKYFKYIQGTPTAVKEAIAKGVNFLTFNLKANKRKLNNAFFSGSLKILMKDYPLIFPANKILDKNNTPIDAQKAAFNDLAIVNEYCVKGYIEDSEYQRKYMILFRNAEIEMVPN